MTKTPANPPTSPAAAIPSSRVYRYLVCGALTEVSGPEFLQLCNPFTMCIGTVCSRCILPPPLDEVAWVDTGETISAFRRRMFDETPWKISYLPWLLALPGAILGLLVALPLFHGIVGSIYWGFLATFAVAGAASFIVVGLGIRMMLAHDFRGHK